MRSCLNRCLDYTHVHMHNVQLTQKRVFVPAFFLMEFFEILALLKPLHGL